EHRRRDGPAHRCRPCLRPRGRPSRHRGRDRSDRRGVLRQEHRRRGRGMGCPPGGSAARRHGIHARGRGRAPVPRHPPARHRRRHQRDPAGSRGQAPGLPGLIGRVAGMTVLRSVLDTAAPEYRAAAESMIAKLTEVEAEFVKAVEGGGPDKLARHRTRGKLTARERIELLIDEDAPFLELFPLAAWGSEFHVGASVVAGIGIVEGVECMIVAHDPTVRGGTSNPWTLRKSLRINDIVRQNRLPLINLVESGGADLPTQKEVFVPGGRLFRDLTQLSAEGIPTIALVFGNSTAGGAYVPGMSDYTVMIKERSKVFLGGPPLVKMATGEESDDESLGGADMHARVSGLADYLAVDEQ